MREMVGGLERLDSALVSSATGAYLRNAHDHTVQVTVQVMDTGETLRDMLSGMLDIIFVQRQQPLKRGNEDADYHRYLATLFMPLSFIAGVYGMNFDYMPELKWHWGYFGVLGLMAGVDLAMLYYFRRKK